MARLEKMDDRPGAPPDSRRIASGAVVLVMSIPMSPTTMAATQLVVRMEPDGQVFAALGRAPSDSA
jgi:hypothetical protein